MVYTLLVVFALLVEFTSLVADILTSLLPSKLLFLILRTILVSLSKSIASLEY